MKRENIMTNSFYDSIVEWDSFYLNNGIRVLHAYDPKINSARVNFVFTGGQLAVKPILGKKIPGLAHFLEHIIVPGNDLKNQEGFYGLRGLNAGTSLQGVRYYFEQLIDTKKMLAVFKNFYQQMFEHSDNITQQRYQKELPIIEAEINMRLPDLRYKHFKEIADYSNVDYIDSQLLSRQEDLRKINSTNLRAFYEGNHAVKNLSIVVTGGLSKKNLLRLLKDSGFVDVLHMGQFVKYHEAPFSKLKNIDYKHFHYLEKSSDKINYNRCYLLSNYSSRVNFRQLEVLFSVLESFLFDKIREELGAVYSISVKGGETTFWDSNMSLQVVTSFSNWGLFEKSHLLIQQLVADFYKQGEKYFLDVQQKMMNNILFSVQNVFSLESYFIGLAESRKVQVESNLEIYQAYRDLTWKDLKFFEDYLQSDQGVLLTSGMEQK